MAINLFVSSDAQQSPKHQHCAVFVSLASGIFCRIFASHHATPYNPQPHRRCRTDAFCFICVVRPFMPRVALAVPASNSNLYCIRVSERNSPIHLFTTRAKIIGPKAFCVYMNGAMIEFTCSRQPMHVECRY